MEWFWYKKPEVLGENPVLVPKCPKQIPHVLACDCNWSYPSVSTVISSSSSVCIKPTSPKRLSPATFIAKLPVSTFLWAERLDDWREIIGKCVGEREGRWGLETYSEELSHWTYFPGFAVFMIFALLRHNWSQNLLKFNQVIESVSRGHTIQWICLCNKEGKVGMAYKVCGNLTFIGPCIVIWFLFFFF